MLSVPSHPLDAAAESAGGEVMYILRRLVYDYVMRRCIKWMDGKKDQALTDSLYWYGIHIERMSGYENSEVR